MLLPTHQNPLPLISLFPLHHQQPNTIPSLSPLTFSHRPPSSSLSPHRTLPHPSWLTRAEPPGSIPDGPIELPSSAPSLLATTDDPTPLQVATSVLLTGAISVFFFRSIRRRAKRLKETKFRSSGAKTLKEEALDNLKVMGAAPLQAKAPPSPVQTLLGGLTAGVIALILYKFTTTIEAALNRQTLSDNYSVRQITITIRTIVNGLCYLATFVFGLNSVGLFLLSGQLALNSIMGGSSSNDAESSAKEQSTSDESSIEGADLSSESGSQESKDSQ